MARLPFAFALVFALAFLLVIPEGNLLFVSNSVQQKRAKAPQKTDQTKSNEGVRGEIVPLPPSGGKVTQFCRSFNSNRGIPCIQPDKIVADAKALDQHLSSRNRPRTIQIKATMTAIMQHRIGGIPTPLVALDDAGYAISDLFGG
jgi:hypothetical protein